MSTKLVNKKYYGKIILPHTTHSLVGGDQSNDSLRVGPALPPVPFRMHSVHFCTRTLVHSRFTRPYNVRSAM